TALGFWELISSSVARHCSAVCGAITRYLALAALAGLALSAPNAMAPIVIMAAPSNTNDTIRFMAGPPLPWDAGRAVGPRPAAMRTIPLTAAGVKREPSPRALDSWSF